MKITAVPARCRRLALVGLLVLACVQSASAGTWKFLVYGDSRGSRITGGVHTAVLADLAAATVAEKPDLVLFTGDLAGAGNPATYAAWKSVMQPVYDAGIPVLPVAGNHELSGLEAFKSMFLAPLAAHPPQGIEDLVLDATDSDGRSYAFRHRGALFLALDEYADNSVQTHAVNQAFVDVQLAGRDPAATPLVFAFGHEPAFRAGRDEGLEQRPAERNAFWRSLEDAGCRAYFCGHMHLYAHARIQPSLWRLGPVPSAIEQVISGAAGAPLYDLKYFDDTGSWTVVDLGHDTTHWGYVRVVVDDATRTVTQTWVRRVAAGSFQDMPDSMFTYSDASRRWLHLWLGAGLVLAGAALLIWSWRKLCRCKSRAAESQPEGSSGGTPGAAGSASVPTSTGEASGTPPHPEGGQP
jgi:hypothetical protein